MTAKFPESVLSSASLLAMPRAQPRAIPIRRYIIFVCLFDAIGKGKPLYTFENMYFEDRQIPLQDGTKKVIINAEEIGRAHV